MNGQPSVSFVIPCHRCETTLARTLRSIADQDYPGECSVLIVSAAPPDPAEAARICRNVSVLKLPQRLPAGPARNAGALQTGGELLAFVDADVELDIRWLTTLVAGLRRHGSAAAGGSVANGNPERWPSRVLHWLEFSEFLPGAERGLRPFLSSSNLLVRRRTYEEVGGFDERLEMGEDMELCLRIRGTLLFEPGAAAVHLHRQEWAEVRAHLYRLGWWSGRLRASGELEAAWLRQAPALALLAAPVRLSRVLARVFSANAAEGLHALLQAPLLMAGLLVWCDGFRKGLSEGAGSEA